MPSFYMFSEEQLRKLKMNDLLKLANYYHVEYVKSRPNQNLIIEKILKSQVTHQDSYIGATSDEQSGMSARIRRIREANKQE